MRKALLLLSVFLFCGVGAFAQQVNLQQIDPADVDMSQVDLSDMEFYFQGPVELYVSGVEYAGQSYAAILDYDGGSTFTIEVPQNVTTAGKPVALDLSQIEASMTQNGLRLQNVVANGYRYSGTVQFQSGQRNFVVTSVSRGGQMVSDRVATLRDQLSQARSQLSQVRQERDNLQSTVGELEDEVASLEDEIAEKDERIDTLAQEGGAQVEINRLEDEAAQLRNQLATARNQLQQARSNFRQRLNELQNELDDMDGGGMGLSASELRQARDAMQQRLDTLEEDIAGLEDDQPEAARLRQVRDNFQQQLNRISQQISNLQDGMGDQPQRATASDRLNRTIVSGFGRGSGRQGSWSMSGGTLRQTDGSQKFAKYVISQGQNSSELLYTFSGRATGSGWRGFGLHFLASGSDRASGYGYGTSYLVWVTRDPNNLQTEQTFVQLYRSYDDQRMVQLASKAIDGSITSANDFEVYVNRNNQQISVSANGELAFTMRVNNMIRSGSNVALRALGTVRFMNLEAMSR
jgi:uncharacterized coiled-coil DUF342 family protein